MTFNSSSSNTAVGYSSVEGDLEGEVNVHRAFISGKDLRRKLPPELFKRKPALFIAKFTFAMGLVAAATAVIAVTSNYFLVVPAMLVNGLIFAHLIELQHECMHEHAFRSSAINRLFGIACGVFMMSSNAHYRYDHLRHHAYLGTEHNLEHFNYKFSNLDSLWGFMAAFFDLSRYKRIAQILWCTVLGRPVPGVDKSGASRAVKLEYVLYLIPVVAGIAASIQSVRVAGIFILAWWLPTLMVAEGVHFLIEMPEHFGLNTMTQPDVLTNTRTIRASPLVRWFVNGNDLHTAHHFHHGVPMCNVSKLHKLIKDRVVVVERSYWSLYKDILSGRIKQNMVHSCMDR